MTLVLEEIKRDTQEPCGGTEQFIVDGFCGGCDVPPFSKDDYMPALVHEWRIVNLGLTRCLVPLHAAEMAVVVQPVDRSLRFIDAYLTLACISAVRPPNRCTPLSKPRWRPIRRCCAPSGLAPSAACQKRTHWGFSSKGESMMCSNRNPNRNPKPRRYVWI